MGEQIDMAVVAGQNGQIERLMSAMVEPEPSTAYGAPTPPQPQLEIIDGGLSQPEATKPSDPADGGFPDAA